MDTVILFTPFTEVGFLAVVWLLDEDDLAEVLLSWKVNDCIGTFALAA